jgi:hypothetical protein
MTEFAGAVWAALRGKRSTARFTVQEVITMATQLFKDQPPHGSPSWFLSCVERAQESPLMEVATLTPALAKAMLQGNFSNRSIRTSKLQQYSSDMASGKWTLNGEPIIISKDGKLNDGQHRCFACIDANASVPVVVMFGIDRETRLTVDQGGARTAGDFLGMEGVANANQVAAIARMVLAYERNGGSGFANANFITSADVRERVAADPKLGESATFGNTNYTYTKRFAGATIVGFSHYILTRAHAADAQTFLERVCRGDGLHIKDPAHTLREKLMSEGKSRDRKVAMILKAWNFHRRGMKVALNSLTSTLPFPALI